MIYLMPEMKETEEMLKDWRISLMVSMLETI